MFKYKFYLYIKNSINFTYNKSYFITFVHRLKNILMETSITKKIVTQRDDYMDVICDF